MSENNPQVLYPLNQVYLYLNGCYSIECRYCQARPKQKGNGNGNSNGHRRSLSLETILQALQEALPLGLRAARLCGSDTFAYPFLNLLLDHLENFELDVTIETDGSGLTPERAARLAQMKQVKIIVAWTHPEPAGPSPFTGLQDGANGAESAVRRLSEAGIAPLVIFPVTRHTVHQIPALIQLAEQAGANAIHFASIPPATAPNLYLATKDQQTPDLPAETLSVEEIIALGRKVEREYSKTTRLRLFFSLPPAFRGLHPQARVEGQGCCDLLNNLSILPDGAVALCSAADTIPELAMGHIGSVPLEQIWRSHPLLIALRKGMPDRLEGVCGRCIMKTACLGYCVAENYLFAGGFWGPNWFCHNAESVGLFPASRLLENTW
jgi:SynChlorMet cassette radical SAM/SPASM protein ScmF